MASLCSMDCITLMYYYYYCYCYYYYYYYYMFNVVYMSVEGGIIATEETYKLGTEETHNSHTNNTQCVSSLSGAVMHTHSMRCKTWWRASTISHTFHG